MTIHEPRPLPDDELRTYLLQTAQELAGSALTGATIADKPYNALIDTKRERLDKIVRPAIEPGFSAGDLSGPNAFLLSKNRKPNIDPASQ